MGSKVQSAKGKVQKGMQRASDIFVLSFLLIVLAALPACSRGKQGPPRTVPVLAEAAEQRDVPLQIKAIGRVEAYTTVAVKSQVTGEISEVLFREGQDVRKGAALFRIDPRSFEAALRQAEAALARDRAQAKNAELEAQRYAALAEKGFVSKQEYDRVRTNFEALSAVVQADEAAVENARLQLEYSLITAPISGRTGTVMVQKGNVVKANDTPALVTINQLTPIFVSFDVPEQDLPEIKQYRAAGKLKVEAIVSPGGAAPEEGTLTFIDNAVNTQTGTILLKATFPNKGHALWPGQFVDVVLTLTTERDRVVVPTAAVQTGQQGVFVYVVKEDRSAEVRSVTAGRTHGAWTVIRQGVQAGETVVTDGQLRLTPGAKVEIKNESTGQQEAGQGEGNHGGAEKDKK